MAVALPYPQSWVSVLNGVVSATRPDQIAALMSDIRGAMHPAAIVARAAIC